MPAKRKTSRRTQRKTPRRTQRTEPHKVVRFRQLATATDGITVPRSVGDALRWRIGDQILVKADLGRGELIAVRIGNE